jgi:DNA-binding FadR family transcriptional regulator
VAAAQSLVQARTSRAELVARALEREIVDDREPGDHLGTKDELRQRFGVAVATINEAVRLLEGRGLIEARPGPGGGVFAARASARVTLAHSVLGVRTDGTAYAEVLEVRDALEPLICRHAARYHRAADIRALEKLVDKMATQQDDPRAFFQTNWRLHRRIARLCRNAPLRSMYLTLVDVLEPILDQAEHSEFDGPGHLRVHRDLGAAIAGGEGPELEAAVERHRPTQALKLGTRT